MKKSINERINVLACNFFCENNSKFAELIGTSEANIRNYRKNTAPSIDILGRICDKLEISYEWLITGRGNMLRTVSNQNVHNFSNTSDFTAQNHSQAVQNQRKDTENILQTTQNRHLIPLYSDISSIGGSNEQIANMDGVSKPSEWIDTGDWFIEATFAIRHYGDSMVEYPNGCILALKEVANIQSLVWGCDYVIETEEYRITKRIQKGNTPNSITAYSSNTEAYPDGRLIHEPVDIPVESIRRIALVLGYVVKKYSSGMVYTIKK